MSSLKWVKAPKLSAAARAAKNTAKRNMRKAAKPVLQAVRVTVPVDSKALRQSLTSKVDGRTASSVTAVIGARKRYSKVVKRKGKPPRNPFVQTTDATKGPRKKKGTLVRRPYKYIALVERRSRPLRRAFQRTKNVFFATLRGEAMADVTGALR